MGKRGNSTAVALQDIGRAAALRQMNHAPGALECACHCVRQAQARSGSAVVDLTSMTATNELTSRMLGICESFSEKNFW